MMSRYRLSFVALAALGIAASQGVAAQSYGQGQTFTDTARVISATPIFDQLSESRQVCRTESVTSEEIRREPGSPAGTIIGGLAGGLIGHQFGSGRGNTAATIAGAAAGAAIGSQYDRDGQTYAVPETRDVERCDVVSEPRDVLRGYNVVYSYNGREFNVQLPNDPGPRLRVDVAVTPQAR